MSNTEYVPDRSKFKDSMGRYLTQSLFLENGYNTELAVYTLTDEDKEYKGTIYPSLRRLYLECMDPTEYAFANKYLWGWEHWQKICNNKLMSEFIDSWRAELEVKIRSAGVKAIMVGALGNFSAARWIADGKWNTQKRGRPSKEELERERKIRERAVEGAADDSDRISYLIRKDDSNE